MPDVEGTAAETTPDFSEGVPVPTPAAEKPRSEVRLEDIWGQFPKTTTMPTFVPKTTKEAFAFNTTKGELWYYDEMTNVWWQVTGADGKGRFQLKLADDATALTTGDGKLIFMIPAFLNGLNLTAAHAFVSTVSSSGLPTFQIRNVTDGVDMLSTKITIDANEYTSYTAATPPVIDTAHDDVATGDLIAIDADGAGTGAKGPGIYLEFS